MSAITEITSVAEWEQALDYYASPSTLVIAYFQAPQSAPGAEIAKPLSTLAAEYSASDRADTKWFSINIEKLPEMGDAYSVSRVPSVVLLRNGKLVEAVESSDVTKVRAAIENHTQEGSSAAPKNIPHTPDGTSSHLADASGASEEPGAEDLQRK